jgi:hypothetical protein
MAIGLHNRHSPLKPHNRFSRQNRYCFAFCEHTVRIARARACASDRVRSPQGGWGTTRGHTAKRHASYLVARGRSRSQPAPSQSGAQVARRGGFDFGLRQHARLGANAAALCRLASGRLRHARASSLSARGWVCACAAVCRRAGGLLGWGRSVACAPVALCRRAALPDVSAAKLWLLWAAIWTRVSSTNDAGAARTGHAGPSSAKSNAARPSAAQPSPAGPNSARTNACRSGSAERPDSHDPFYSAAGHYSTNEHRGRCRRKSGKL